MIFIGKLALAAPDLMQLIGSRLWRNSDASHKNQRGLALVVGLYGGTFISRQIFTAY
ncbi:MAG: hypothetical protein ACOCXH_04390 [Cyclobacteriaceae bacterium]